MLSLILAAALMDPTVTPVVLPSEPAPLHATLLTPEGPTRAVAVILPGSGPTDRDGNSPIACWLKDWPNRAWPRCGSTSAASARAVRR